ncbi:unnamed protein product [Cochlearia groenlandica]
MAEEIKNVQEHEIPKVTTEESSETTGEIKDRGMFDFIKKKEDVKPPQETPLDTEKKEPSLLEKLHAKHEEEEENKPSLLHKLHRSNSSSSSSSDEEGNDGEKKKKEKKKKATVEGDAETEEEKKGVMEKIKETLPGHNMKLDDGVPVVTTAPMAETQRPMEIPAEHTEEKKGILEKIKEKLPGNHSKREEEEEVKKVKESQ